MITHSYIVDLKWILELAEANVRDARAATSFLQSQSRVMNAEEVRDKVQATYTAALARYTSQLANGEPPATS